MFPDPATAERFVTPQGHWAWALNVPGGPVGVVRRIARVVVLTPDAMYHLEWPDADAREWARLVEPLKSAIDFVAVVPRGMTRIPYSSIRSVAYLAEKQMVEVDVEARRRSAFARMMVPDRPLQLFMPAEGMADELFRGLHQRIDPARPVTSVPVRVDQIPVTPIEFGFFLFPLIAAIVLVAASYSSPTDPDPAGDLLRSFGTIPCRVLGCAIGAGAFGWGIWQIVRRPHKQLFVVR